MNASASAGPMAAWDRYRNFHLWMLLPFAISVLGFSYSYYFNLKGATFHQHVHGLSATLWYVLVIVQPWLITRKGDIRRHRLLGAFATLLAGVIGYAPYTTGSDERCAAASSSAGSSDQSTMSIFSPCSSFITLRTRCPIGPMQAPFAFTPWTVERTAILVR